MLTIETRPEHVDFEELEFIARALKESEGETKLEIAIGFEAFDDDIRNMRSADNRGVLVREEVMDAFGLRFLAMTVRVDGATEAEALDRAREDWARTLGEAVSPLTYYEFLTVLAMWQFARSRVDVGVFETQQPHFSSQLVNLVEGIDQLRYMQRRTEKICATTAYRL